jgi:cytochrome c-type biogenesis protein CcmE
MHPVRRKRLTAVLFMLGGVAVTVALVLSALKENMNLFYTPAEVVAGAAPEGVRIRAGGMVEEGSIRRAEQGLTVEFIVSDMAGSAFTVEYTGILPALFREGQGVIATGMLNGGRFVAEEVLARHDEEYIPAELIQLHDAALGARGEQGAGGEPNAAAGATTHHGPYGGDES